MKKIFGFFILTLVLVSCGGNKENRPLNEYVSAFLKDNKTIVAFGKADINTLLNKSEYKLIPKFGIILEHEIEAFKRSLKTETPVYFALEGPLDEDATPKSTYVFLEVVNADSLSQKLSQQGFDMEKSGDFEYFQSGDVSLGIRNNLAILVSKKEDFVGEEVLKEAFDKVKDDVSEGKIDQILAAKGDVVLGMNIENLYGTSNTSLSDLSKEKQESLKELVADSYVQTTLLFDNGGIVIESNNLFSDNLKQKMFFKSDASAGIVSNLGTGKPTIGFAMNLDLVKFQAFVDEYSPNTMKELGQVLGSEFQLALAMGGKKGIGGLFSGDLGAVMVGEANAMEGLSDFNFYLGLEKNGLSLAENFKELLVSGEGKVELNQKGLSYFSSLDYAPKAGQKLKIPKGCESFGKKGITAFVDLENVDLSSFEFEEEQKMIYLIKYMTFEMDENGSRIYIQAKDGKANMLKQAVDVLVKELSGKIGNIAI